MTTTTDLLTKQERADVRLFLKQVKKNLARDAAERADKDAFICCAIATVIDRVNSGYHAAIGEYLHNLIRERLDGFETLEGWLTNQGFSETPYSNSYRTKVQVTRHAWIDSLIKEHS